MKLMNALSGFLQGRAPNYSAEPTAKDGPSGETKRANLDDLIKGKALGFAVERNGVLDVDSVASERNPAVALFLLRNGYAVMAPCQKPGCDCLVEPMKELVPGSKLVEVAVSKSD